PMSWSPNSTRTDKEIYNRHCATPKPAESVTFPKSAVTFAEIRTRRDASGKWVLGPCVWQRIGVFDRPTMCVAGIWRTLRDLDGRPRHAMTMITVNADDHPVMSRMHKPDDEKRSVVILRPDDWEEWLTTPNVEAARAMLQLYPADEMFAEPK
ncbi:SOS response-associated peptidase family protein, partial [Burkholderia vietnamiensis]|uniref:SOS response-associated peptidase family protein n=1 Tax=Burkholderia vietnamiensis TaxID=60552 RepID=UPI002DD42678